MEQKTIKIQVLNDTKLCVLPVLPDLKTVVPVESISELEVRWGLNGHATDPVTLGDPENGYIVLPISHTMPLGVYSVHMTGKINGQEWSDNRYEMFELVKYGEGIRYDRYYTKTVILGLPDDTLHQIISEYEAKRDEYQRMIDELNRGEVATKADLGLEPGETVAGLIKAGGGGGLTPEQWAQIAKEETALKLWQLDNATRAMLSKIKDDDPHAYANRIEVTFSDGSKHYYDYAGVQYVKEIGGEKMFVVCWMHAPTGASRPFVQTWDTKLYSIANIGWGKDREDQRWKDYRVGDLYDDPELSHQISLLSVSEWQNVYLAQKSDTDALGTKLSELSTQVGEIKDLLTLEDGEVTAELQTLIPNEEETV